MSNFPIDTVHMNERTLLCARHVGPYHGIGAAFEVLERELSKLGIKAEAMLAIYHDNPELVSQDSLRSDAAAQVSPSDLIAASTLTPFTLEAGKFARWLHKGPYSELHQTWQAGYRALAASGVQAKGVCYEEYLNDPCQTKPDELMTAIYQRIE
ncbi:MAG: GyrI-like domain-containing protein [Betaproteobacteria bacterium]|nr:GyrI-like domain-containing protein [Betaproteobacteria bacterium]NCV25399.1 GyrI-like domain-containing protein [Betaproteobacteria bacterium]NCV60457.1 GyrI-like domain-containing protein [Betaproteobacteria bacterium]NCV69914.1 GyrI-like domain-containing protein [Betaproteobacteria bacterium]NCW02145.1 GyrI-like domain-containing protein [Betaproteobacteria bacterium]